jgi:hypothetical protein
MTPLDLVDTDDPAVAGFGRPESDPLAEADALREAQLVDLRFDAVRRRLGLLFDLRQALGFRSGNTAVLVLYDVADFRWDSLGRTEVRTPWYVVDSRATPRQSGTGLELSLAFVPDGQFVAAAGRGVFYVGQVPGIPEAPPDFAEDEEDLIRAGLPGWDSGFEVFQAST